MPMIATASDIGISPIPIHSNHWLPLSFRSPTPETKSAMDVLR